MLYILVLYRLRSKGDNALGRVRPSVHLNFRPIPSERLTWDLDVDEEVMEFYDMVMEKSWNFVAKISWQPCNSPGLCLRVCNLGADADNLADAVDRLLIFN